MRFSLRCARLPMAILAMCVSLASGGILAFRLVTPEMLGRLATPELMALLGLLLLPAATAWAFFADRRSARRRAETEAMALAASQVEAQDAVLAGVWTSSRTFSEIDESGLRSVRSWAWENPGPTPALALRAEADRGLPGRRSAVWHRRISGGRDARPASITSAG